MDGLKETLLNLIKSAMNGFDSTVSSAQDVLTGGLFDTNAVWSSVLALSNALKPFCYVVIGICLLIEIAQVAAKVDIIKWEHGLKLCVKMVFAKLCIDIAPTFLRACYNQASLWISSAMSVGGYTNLGSLMTTEVETQISSISGIWSVIGLLASCLLLSICTACGIAASLCVLPFGGWFGRRHEPDNTEIFQELHSRVSTRRDDYY